MTRENELLRPEYAAAFIDGYEQAQDDAKKVLTREADRGPNDNS